MSIYELLEDANARLSSMIEQAADLKFRYETVVDDVEQRSIYFKKKNLQNKIQRHKAYIRGLHEGSLAVRQETKDSITTKSENINAQMQAQKKAHAAKMKAMHDECTKESRKRSIYRRILKDNNPELLPSADAEVAKLESVLDAEVAE